MAIDIEMQNHGSIFQFVLLTDAARAWVEDNVHLEAWQWLGQSFAVDHRFARDLVEGMLEYGLEVEES